MLLVQHQYYRLKIACPDSDLYKSKYKEFNLKLVKELKKAKKYITTINLLKIWGMEKKFGN